MSAVLSRKHVEKTERGLKLLIDCGYEVVELDPERGGFLRADTIQASANILGEKIAVDPVTKEYFILDRQN